MTARKMLGVQPNDLVLLDGQRSGPEKDGTYRVTSTIGDGRNTKAVHLAGCSGGPFHLWRLSYADETRLGDEDMPPDERIYRATLVDVIEANDLVLDFDLGFGVSVRRRVRVAGVELPLPRVDEARRNGRRFARVWLGRSAGALLVRTHRFQRLKLPVEYLVDIWLREDGSDYGADAVRSGCVKPWGPPPGSKP